MNQAPSLTEWNEEEATGKIDLEQMDQLVIESVRLWDEYEKKKKIASEANAAAEAHDGKILKILQAAKKDSYKVDGVGTISITHRSSVATPKTIEDKVSFYDYLKKTSGAEVMYSFMSPNSQSLNSWYKEKLEKAKKDDTIATFKIPGLAGTVASEILSFRKDTKKGKV